jgi:nucleoid-associated protein YgaU
MSFNIKIALLTSVAFISGFCWIVNRFGRPLIEEPAGAALWLPMAREPEAARARAGATGFDASPSGLGLARPSVVNRVSAPPIAAGRPLPPARALVAAASVAALPPLMHTPAGEAEAVPSDLLTAEADPAPESTPGAIVQVAASATDETLVPVLDTLRSRTDAPPPVAAGSAPQLSGDAVGATYVVQRGDSLSKIARKLLGRDDAATLKAFAAANPRLERRNYNVHLGETLVVPNGGVPVAAAQAVREYRATPAGRSEKPRATERSTGRPAEPAQAAPSASKRRPKSSGESGSRVAGASGTSGRPAGTKPGETRGAKWYTIRESDSLKRIARREMKNENRWREIAQLNGLKEGVKLAAGTRIKLPGDERIAQR